MRVLPVAGTRSTRTPEAVGQPDRPCVRCGADAVDTIDHRHTFRYGSGESAADLTVTLPVRRCGKCGFEFLDRESERIKLEAICEHLGVLSPSGIRRIRERYGMTQAEFAEVTGLGTATLVRWENGSMNHTRAYDRYMRLLENRRTMNELRRLGEPATPDSDLTKTVEGRWRALRDANRRKGTRFSLRRNADARPSSRGGGTQRRRRVQPVRDAASTN